MRSEEIAWVHLFALNLPFDTTKPFFYWPFFSFELWMMFCMGWIIISTDMLHVTLTHLVTMELNNLGLIMGEIGWVDEDEESEEKAIRELKKLSRIHQQLIEVTNELDTITSLLLFVNAFSCLMILCVASFLAVTGEGHLFMVKYILPATAIAWQFFIQCHFGNAITDASLKVSEGVYNSAWYKASPKYRKLALLVMMRAQKAQKLTGWKFIDINMETYFWIIQTAHTYYSFLKGIYNS
ncbi:hypothetical protein PVAND_016043 [Polypedilum vanderplanki]|uniref:Uncharacterized protein n=1 Tax=Polypedilum vanderplanki TaxID=319348 RepID=A0A9J6BEQ1_POLVA|nr:hypothetical protein PVAND_016043 [Polypedilum vanderplanki]